MSFLVVALFMCQKLLNKHNLLFKMWIIFILSALFSAHNAANASQKVEVRFNDNERSISIWGKQIGHSYLFNEKSNKILKLATLDWPPYISEKLCNNGWVFQLTVALLVSKGYQVQIQFLPWTRAVRAVELGDHDILFPEYFIDSNSYSINVKSERRRDLLALSERFDGGLLSLVKRKNEIDFFNGKLTNILDKVVGVVRGYQNTPEFDALVAKGQIKTIAAVDELQLARMLIANRVDYIIVDPKVLRYVIIHSPLNELEKQTLLHGIENIKPEVKYNHLYYAVSKRKSAWLKVRNDLNSAITKFKENGEIQRIIENSDKCLNAN